RRLLAPGRLPGVTGRATEQVLDEAPQDSDQLGAVSEVPGHGPPLGRLLTGRTGRRLGAVRRSCLGDQLVERVPRQLGAQAVNGTPVALLADIARQVPTAEDLRRAASGALFEQPEQARQRVVGMVGRVALGERWDQ